MQKWYAANFSATPQGFGKLDHIGFEVKNLEGRAKTLEANSAKLDTPYRTIPQMGFAVAFIELTERTAAAPSAQNQKPTRQ
jgi:hypothetical protein